MRAARECGSLAMARWRGSTASSFDSTWQAVRASSHRRGIEEIALSSLRPHVVHLPRCAEAGPNPEAGRSRPPSCALLPQRCGIRPGQWPSPTYANHLRANLRWKKGTRPFWRTLLRPFRSAGGRQRFGGLRASLLLRCSRPCWRRSRAAVDETRWREDQGLGGCSWRLRGASVRAHRNTPRRIGFENSQSRELAETGKRGCSDHDCVGPLPDDVALIRASGRSAGSGRHQVHILPLRCGRRQRRPASVTRLAPYPFQRRHRRGPAARSGGAG